MGEDSISEDNTTTNKGVNVHSESLPARVHRYPDLDTSSSANTSVRSITDIRNELQTVLDLMGPTTTPNSSSEADNEESIASVIFQEQIKARRTISTSNREKKSRSSSAAQESSVSASKDLSSGAESKDGHTLSKDLDLDSDKDLDTNRETVMADAGTVSTLNHSGDFDDLEHSCCDHNRLFVSPECVCMVNYMNQNLVPMVPARPCEVQYSPSNKSTAKTTAVTTVAKKRNIIDWLKERSVDLKLKKSNLNANPYELYRINICGHGDDGTNPKRVVFDMVDGLPRPTSSTVATNTVGNNNHAGKSKRSKNIGLNANCDRKELKNITNGKITMNQDPNKIQKNIFYDGDGNKRVDFYYFDHGNTHYFRTTDTPPLLMSEIIAEKTERYTTKFWAEFFASIHIVVAFCISFILQFFKFLLYSIVRPLAVGLIQMGSDYFFKPFLTILFNGLLQPFLIFLYNVATSLRDLCDPIAEGFGYFCRELAVVFRAIRLCSYKKSVNEDCDCDKKKCEC